jgi:hypothetical protein
MPVRIFKQPKNAMQSGIKVAEPYILSSDTAQPTPQTLRVPKQRRRCPECEVFPAGPDRLLYQAHGHERANSHRMRRRGFARRLHGLGEALAFD